MYWTSYLVVSNGEGIYWLGFVNWWFTINIEYTAGCPFTNKKESYKLTWDKDGQWHAPTFEGNPCPQICINQGQTFPFDCDLTRGSIWAYMTDVEKLPL